MVKTWSNTGMRLDVAQAEYPGVVGITRRREIVDMRVR